MGSNVKLKYQLLNCFRQQKHKSVLHIIIPLTVFLEREGAKA